MMPVLIFEKSPEITTRLIEMIKDAHSEVSIFSAATYAEADLLLQHIHPGTVMLNINFPGNISLELLSQVRKKYIDTTIIMVYTYASEYQLQQCTIQGADHLLNLYDEFDKLPLLIRQKTR